MAVPLTLAAATATPDRTVSVALAATDDVLTRRVTKIAEGAGMVIALRAPTVTELLGEANGRPVDVVVIEGRDNCAIETRAGIRAIQDGLPQAKVILLCSAPSRRVVRAALAAGVHGLLLASEANEGLAAAIQAAYSGQIVISARLPRGGPELLPHLRRQRDPHRLQAAPPAGHSGAARGDGGGLNSYGSLRSLDR